MINPTKFFERFNHIMEKVQSNILELVIKPAMPGATENDLQEALSSASDLQHIAWTVYILGRVEGHAHEDALELMRLMVIGVGGVSSALFAAEAEKDRAKNISKFERLLGLLHEGDPKRAKVEKFLEDLRAGKDPVLEP